MKYLLAVAVCCPFVYWLSFNSWLWLEAGVALLLSITLIYRHQRTYPALMWVLAFNWLGSVGAIATADLGGMSLVDVNIGQFRVEAFLMYAVALVVLAAGIGIGLWLPTRQGQLAKQSSALTFDCVIDLPRGVLLYFGSLILVEVSVLLIAFVPTLLPELYALQMVKFTCIYVVAWVVFSTGRGYLWLLSILAFEVVTGMTGFFGTFKEAFIVVLIAFLATSQRPSIKAWIFGTAAAICVLTLALTWTAVKKDYRQWVNGGTSQQTVVQTFGDRVGWMLDHIFETEINWYSLRLMTARIDTTGIYAKYLSKADVNYEMNLPSRYLAGFTNLLMPRFLFPDKPILNDSEITTAMTGLVFDEGTSVSIGYIAEAQYDFGVSWMFVPIFLIGMLMAFVGRYFMSRAAPYVIRQAFATTAIFNSFSFEMNFNKALGGFVLLFIALALVLKFAYPLIGGWLAGRGSIPKRLVGPTGA